MRQWVWKYEVSARVDSGRTWFPLGVFEGNRDMTTEVAHKLVEPVRCRYLRFRVLGFDRVPAMRVGVYGRRPRATGEQCDLPEVAGNAQQTAVLEDGFVRYCISRVEAGRVREHVQPHEDGEHDAAEEGAPRKEEVAELVVQAVVGVGGVGRAE